jgi:hypothetical protein
MMKWEVGVNGELFDAINALGVVGLLGFMVLAFYRGDLIARAVLDRILEVYEKRLTALIEEILEKLGRIVQ